MNLEEINFNNDFNNYTKPISPLEGDFEWATEKHIEDVFDEEGDAVFNLYEQLFTTGNSIDAQLIYDAVKYLLWKKKMSSQYEEMDKLDKNDICVQHINDTDREVKEKLSYFKAIVTEVVEDYV